MVLKRRISYQWRLFIPLLITEWILLSGMAYWQYQSIHDSKMDRLEQNLRVVNSRVIEAYSSGDTALIRPFMKFADRYYREDKDYDDIRISLFMDTVRQISVGPPISLADARVGMCQELWLTASSDRSYGGNQYYSQTDTSSDGRLMICTQLPLNQRMGSFVTPDKNLLYVIFAVAIVLSIIAFMASRHLTKNLRMLRQVAERAANDPNYLPMMDFPHDELGDINRQIVHLYNERSQAWQQQKREHAIAMNAVEEKARIKRQMSSNINHELRTPIGVIKGYLDTLVENPEMDEGTRIHFISKAREHSERLVSLISDVSAITRLEEGGEVINTEELNFHDIIYTIADEILESKILAPMTFKYNIPLQCLIQGNGNLLQGMIMNLARNAAAYSKGTECGIDCVGEDSDFYTFSFWDNGKGVGEEHLPHLFERFYRVDSGRARKSGGTGLGLPIVKGVVNSHGGKIDVRNREQGGLEFVFTLPKAGKIFKRS